MTTTTPDTTAPITITVAMARDARILGDTADHAGVSLPWTPGVHQITEAQARAYRWTADYWAESAYDLDPHNDPRRVGSPWRSTLRVSANLRRKAFAATDAVREAESMSACTYIAAGKSPESCIEANRLHGWPGHRYCGPCARIANA